MDQQTVFILVVVIVIVFILLNRRNEEENFTSSSCSSMRNWSTWCDREATAQRCRESASYRSDCQKRCCELGVRGPQR